MKGWALRMTEENRPDQPAAESRPAPKKTLAASKESAAPLVAPSAALTGPISIEPVPTRDESVWDEVGDGMVFTDEDFAKAVGLDERKVMRSTNARRASAWVQGPGAVAALVEAIKLLRGAAKAAGTPMKEIKAVIVKALPEHDVVLVAPVKDDTPGSIEARREGRGPLMFTISEILRDAGMEVTSGYKDLYPVRKVARSPLGPCIAIDMAKAIESKKVGKKKEEE